MEKQARAAAPGVLPVPEAVVSHHGETLFRLMSQWRDSRRVPPVLLFTGGQGMGKRSMAYLLAQWLLCERSGFQSPSDADSLGLFGESPIPAAKPGGEPRPCGECASCQRALKGNWVDFQEVSTNSDEGDSGTLKIDQFRDLKATMGFGAYDSAFRIILIRDADRMTIQAANSILKMLEEPPRGWIFLLTASDPSLLLPTIISRCQILRLRPFTRAELITLLQTSGIPSERHAICARLAEGSWGKALALGSEESWSKRKQVIQFLENPSEHAGPLIEWSAQEPENMQLLLDQLEQLTRDLLEASVNPSYRAEIAPDAIQALGSHAARAEKKLGTMSARKFWLERADRAFRARRESLTPMNKKILAQDLLLPWLQI